MDTATETKIFTIAQLNSMKHCGWEYVDATDQYTVARMIVQDDQGLKWYYFSIHDYIYDDTEITGYMQPAYSEYDLTARICCVAF